MKGATSIQERLWELRKDKGLNLEELSELTGISKSALGSYEKEDYKEINHGNLITLADFYGVSVDYLLCRTENREQINTPLTELHLNDEMVALLKSGRINNRLLCELATHKDFIKFLADIEIYVDGMLSIIFTNAVDTTSSAASSDFTILKEMRWKCTRCSWNIRSTSARCSSFKTPNRSIIIIGSSWVIRCSLSLSGRKTHLHKCFSHGTIFQIIPQNNPTEKRWKCLVVALLRNSGRASYPCFALCFSTVHEHWSRGYRCRNPPAD